jgi:hypothetical protein
VPSEDKSRSSRRRRGLRGGLTLCVDDSSGNVLLCCGVVCSLLTAGGSAEACGAGGELDVEDAEAVDMVWNSFGVAEEVMLTMACRDQGSI